MKPTPETLRNIFANVIGDTSHYDRTMTAIIQAHADAWEEREKRMVEALDGIASISNLLSQTKTVITSGDMLAIRRLALDAFHSQEAGEKERE